MGKTSTVYVHCCLDVGFDTLKTSGLMCPTIHLQVPANSPLENRAIVPVDIKSRATVNHMNICCLLTFLNWDSHFEKRKLDLSVKLFQSHSHFANQYFFIMIFIEFQGFSAEYKNYLYFYLLLKFKQLLQ